MNYRQICLLLGKYLFYFSLVLFIPLGVSLYFDFIADPKLYPQSRCWLEFLETIGISFALAFLFLYFGKNAKSQLQRREGILLVVIIWLISAFIGAFPFYLTGTLKNPLDAYFETMSGFTTTGASILCPKNYDEKGNEIPIYDTNPHVPEQTYIYYGTVKPVREPKTQRILFSGVEALSKGLIFWRSFIQWLGGMGIVVLFLAIFPTLAVGGKFLYHAEVPGPIKETLTPRIKDTSAILWKLYLGLTVLQIYLLIWTNDEMPLLDAFCITFSTLSTGGFSPRNFSIGSYQNIHTEWIVILFMILGSINFAFYFHLIRRKLFRIYEPDFIFYLLTIFLSSTLVSINIIGTRSQMLDGLTGTYSLSSAIREGTFQAVSAQTSTGFATTNYDIWPFFPQLIMLLSMFIGGMTGSTAGGIKTSRYYILLKILRHKIEQIFRPQTIKKLSVGGLEIDDKTTITVLAFFCIAIFFVVLGTVLLVFDAIDPETAFSTITCMMNNIGLGFRAAGPTNSFAFLPPLSKIISIFWMLLGRLEFFALLILFIPSFWKTQQS